MPVAAGLILILFDIFVLLPRKRTRVDVRWEPLMNTNLTVVLTAYNDEPSIAMAVNDFVMEKAAMEWLNDRGALFSTSARPKQCP